MITTTKDLTDKLRTELRNGEITVVPSTRYLAFRTGLHRNSCAKALQQLKREGLIDTQMGRVSIPISKESDPVDIAIDKLLETGMSLEQAQIQLLNSLDRRRKITVVGENKELIKSELEVEGFEIGDGDNGFKVSDTPNKGDFLLMLSNPKELGLDKQKVSSIGIISACVSYRVHIRGALSKFTGDIVEATPKRGEVNSALHLCRIIVCDSMIAPTLKEFAGEYRQRNGGAPNNIVPVPYLNKQSIDQLRRLVRCS